MCVYACSRSVYTLSRRLAVDTVHAHLWFMHRLGPPGSPAPASGVLSGVFTSDAAFVCALCGRNPVGDCDVCDGVLRRKGACSARHILCGACGVPSMSHSTLCPVSGCGMQTHAYDVVNCSIEMGVVVAADADADPPDGYPLEWDITTERVVAPTLPRGPTGVAVTAQVSCVACSRPARVDAPTLACVRCRYAFHVTERPCVGPGLLMSIDDVRSAAMAIPRRRQSILCRHCSIGGLVAAPCASFKSLHTMQGVYGSAVDARRRARESRDAEKTAGTSPSGAGAGAGAGVVPVGTTDSICCDTCFAMGTLLTIVACHEPTCRWRGCVRHVVRCMGSGCGRGVCPGCSTKWLGSGTTCSRCFILDRDKEDGYVADDGLDASASSSEEEDEFDFDAPESGGEEEAAAMARLGLGKFVCDIGCGGKRSKRCAACTTRVCTRCGTRCRTPGCGVWVCDAHTLACQACNTTGLCPGCMDDASIGHRRMLCVALPAQRLAASASASAKSNARVKCQICRTTVFRSADEIERCPVEPRHSKVCASCMHMCSKCHRPMCARCTMAQLGDAPDDGTRTCVRLECLA